MIALLAAALSLLLLTATASPLNVHLDKRQSDMLSTINGWRHTVGASPLSWSQDMANAAANTGRLNGGGVSMNHHPANGAAEVISPGSDTAMGQNLKGRSPFEISFIAWICEKPSPAMGNACQLVDTNRQDAVMRITNSGTGHHDILVDSQYKQIGCAFTKNKNPSQWFLGQGQWVCDLKR
ncbi:MAG: hypothetical protein L6R36_009491 [Xanthoria steineri]|nr:MAG: hypothetical protein L6R36_009491 [Xanthoria steineri]